jgi:hypothetical protein
MTPMSSWIKCCVFLCFGCWAGVCSYAHYKGAYSTDHGRIGAESDGHDPFLDDGVKISLELSLCSVTVCVYFIMFQLMLHVPDVRDASRCLPYPAPYVVI